MKIFAIISLISIMLISNIDKNAELRQEEEILVWNEIRENKKNIELETFMTGMAHINHKTFTQPTNGKIHDERIECEINAFGFTHPQKGDILIDAGLPIDFTDNPPYGNLGMLVKIFQKKNEVTYHQKIGEDIMNYLGKKEMSPKHVFITHLHPDHTAGVPYLNDDVIVYYGKKEDTFYYKILTKKHLKNKKESLIDFTEGVELDPFDNVIDVFGDQSLFAISTKGHTKDHIAYLINGVKPYLIIGDAELTKETTQRGIYISSDYGEEGEKDARESAEKIRSFCKMYPEVEVWYSHDL